MTTKRVEEVRVYMDTVLNILRDEKQERSENRVEKVFDKSGIREISLAITQFETGCMWLIRSEFADEGEYSPLTRLQKVT